MLQVCCSTAVGCHPTPQTCVKFIQALLFEVCIVSSNCGISAVDFQLMTPGAVTEPPALTRLLRGGLDDWAPRKSRVQKRQSVRMNLKARDLTSQETSEILGTERMKRTGSFGWHSWRSYPLRKRAQVDMIAEMAKLKWVPPWSAFATFHQDTS